MTESNAPQGSPSLNSIVSRVAVLIARGGGGLTAGDVASLRRMSPAEPSAAFFKLVGLALDDHLPTDPARRDAAETRWATIVVGLAHLGDLHTPGARLGRVLAEAGYSELRFGRLLRADLDQLQDDLPSLARFLASKGLGADWSEAARLLFSAGGPSEEPTRRALARDYYRAVTATERAEQAAK